jgi:hypothetical protein
MSAIAPATVVGCVAVTSAQAVAATSWLDALDDAADAGLKSLRIRIDGAGTDAGLGKDAPLRRAVQRSGTIATTPILSGLHHSYARI